MKNLRELIQRLLGHRETRRVLAGAMGTAVVLLSVAAHASGGGEGEHVPHVNWWEWTQKAPPVGWFIVDFIIFVGLLGWLLKGPLTSMFQKRHTEIKDAIEEAQAAHKKAKAHRDEYLDKLTRVDEEIGSLVEGARADGTQTKDAIIRAAKGYSSQLRGDSDAAADQEAQSARIRLKNEVVGAVMTTAETMLDEKLSAEDQQRLLEEAIGTLENGGATLERYIQVSTHASAGGAA